MPLIYDLSIGKNHMLSVSIILNKKMLHFYEQSWQNQIERILPKGLIQSKCKIFKMIQKMPLSLSIYMNFHHPFYFTIFYDLSMFLTIRS